MLSPKLPTAARPGSTTAATDSRVLIVSNRLPLSLRPRGGRLHITASDGGLATGLEEIRRAATCLWIGWPGVAAHESLAGWADLEPRFREGHLVPVSLSAEEVAGYYDGFSNGVIWPLLHHLLDRIPIDSGNWTAYRRVNMRFAEEVARLWRPGDRIWIHDYHLMLLPGLLRGMLPQARIGYFHHIPFPGTDVFRALPWRTELLEGLLGADLIGFHTHAYVQHFLSAVRQLLALEPLAGHLWWQDRAIHVDALPMGVDTRRLDALSRRPAVEERAEAIRRDAQGRRILLGVDRLDYTKGIPRRLLAFQRLLERHRALADQVRFVQVAVPSRIDVRAYKTFRREIDELIGRINGAFGTVGSVPIHYLYRSVPPQELAALYRAADVMVVTPLRDGMNLVAKEFVACRTDEDGVLVLSEFAGAAAELDAAILVNPYDVDGVADAMARAVTLDREERRTRMQRLRGRVAEASVHDWAQKFLTRLGHVRPPAAADTSGHDALAAFDAGILTLKAPLTLVVDYDGTLVPIADSPDGAAPDPDLVNLLTALAVHPQIDLHIATGRSIDNVQRWLWQVPATLWAEHGAACRRKAGTWERVVAADSGWMESARSFFATVCARTPGALLEHKATGVAWHYRMVDPDLAASELQRVRAALPALLEGMPVDVMEGRKVIEIRPRGVSKALVVRSLTSGASHDGSIVVIGDDRTDEEMFTVTPPWGVAIRVGAGQTRATHRLSDPAAVRRFLTRILAAHGARLRLAVS